MNILRMWFLLILVFPLGALDIQVLDQDLEIPLEGVRILCSTAQGITDEAGKATLDLGSRRQTVSFSLQGYETLRVTAQEGTSVLLVKLRVSGLLEGKELVVEKAAPLKNDSQAGVSLAVSKQEMQTAAQIGIVEDVMSAVKTLPGVGYSGGWNAAPSIRGGSPSETTAYLDGFEVSYPYHWGGAFSIFNPNMVESAKLSAGLVSARYGRILSGLLEVNTKTPTENDLHWESSITTTGLEAYIQAPLNSYTGLVLGGKLTWMEVSFNLAGAAGGFTQVPYIRDVYGKWYWNPSDRLKFFVNGFFNSDGVGTISESLGSDLKTKDRFDWTNSDIILSGGMKWLVSDFWQVQAQGGWNHHEASPVLSSLSSGFKAYSPDFLSLYDGSALDTDGVVGTIKGQTGFNLDGTYFKFKGTDVNDNFQGRLENQWVMAPGQNLVFGGESNLYRSTYSENVDGYTDMKIEGVDYYSPLYWNLTTQGNRTLNSGAFLLWDFAFAEDKFTGELGVRGDHTYLWNEEMSLQSYPVVNPRLRLSYQALKNAGDFKSLIFTSGAGLFSKMTSFTQQFKKEFNLKDFEFGPDRNWFVLAGTEVQLEGGWKFSLETYYKNYFQRTYLTKVPELNPMKIEVRGDGQGFAAGFDLLVQKKEGRYFDGYLTYSFMMARYLNPSGTGPAIQPQAAPVGEWYYPAYHRFHSVNLIGNFKPLNWLTLSVKGALASGAPKTVLGDREVKAALMPDGQLVERWSRTSTYSDTLRNDISCPVDLKFVFSDYYEGSKIRWEYYFGVENVFASFYTPKTNKALDGFSGKEQTGSGEAEFTIGAPVPSFGFKLSY